MSAIVLIIMMIVIGAIIGGLTNSLAIKMLFRPYEAKYLGSWKLPFTPGLIPKRRDELARQLGRMVVEHLLTPSGIRKKLQQPIFQKQLTSWAQKETASLLESNATLKEALASLGFTVNERDVREKIAELSGKQYREFVSAIHEQTLHEFLPPEWEQKLNNGVSRAGKFAQDKLAEYLSSTEARNKIGTIVENYLDGKGFFGNMISSFLGNEGLADKIQPLLVDYVRSEEAGTIIEKMLGQEVERLYYQTTIGQLEEKVGPDEIAGLIGQVVSRFVPVDRWLNKSIQAWTGPFKQQILTNMVPNMVDKISSTLGERMEKLMDSLHLAEIVEKEVEAFPTKRIEQLVLDISRREFKMITYLGALLGGAIGFIQGLIVTLLN
ncbi:DUF445 domain-containing protein [Sediminibacillus halophilus]|uniref:Uncharacterized membrane protein YheB, UPF0754 family n=1 Tax=Sediminibacillus halophilus TaxID=482461 RepID=A0A1G9PQB1_9BACI|nr:DUF445 family protein [Sediminibacillus halophilus]SDM01052.1 Uncharacterized membrane protein YheB, UPF0754 family [Sediminibacillus halophilus]